MTSGLDERPAAPSAPRSSRLAGLDGLRALAVAGVVLYHLGAPWLRGGFLGVDLFFVVSGFLITTLLIEERGSSGGIGLKAFWLRRSRRLLPALVLLIAAVMLYVVIAGRAGSLTVGALDLGHLRGDGIATLAYVANWNLILTSQSYFTQFSTPSPLLHTWSLAIEEQFYILWPLAVIVMLRARSVLWRRIGVATAVVGAAASAIAMAVLFHPGHDPSRVYYGTDTRAFDLLIGAGLAFSAMNRTPSRKVARRLRTLGPLAAVVLLVLWVLAGDSNGSPRDWMYRGGFLACALLAAVVIASSVFAPGGKLTKFLSLKPLVVLGAVSYGVYLWHWPIIVFLDPQQTHLSGIVLDGVRIALIAVFTTLSYVLIEQPIRHRRWPAWIRGIVYPISIVLVVILIIMGTTPSVVSPPSSISKHFNASGTLAGVGGLEGQQVIALSQGRPSAAHPLRVGLFGDSMVFVAHAGLQAALESTGVITTQNFSFPGWGTSTIPLWREQLTKTIRESHTQIIIGTWRWDDDVALAHPKQYAATLREVVSVARSAGAEGVILLSYPKTGPPGGGKTKAELAHNARAEAAWQRLAAQLPSQAPGRAMFMPIAPSVELKDQFSTWLPPVGDLAAPAVRWERVRRLDGVHLCIPGIDRFATALTRDLTLAFTTPPAKKGWTAGDWTQDLTLTIDSNKCPADHPAWVPGRTTR